VLLCYSDGIENMTREFEVFRTYINEAGGIRTYQEITADSYFAYMLKTGEIVFDRDHPDMYIRSGDDILIIEHFEFDSYPRKKGKGSEFRREESRIDRKLDELEYHEHGRTLIDSIHGDSSYENYIANAEHSFMKHYGEIEKYKDRLRDEGIITSRSKVKVLFFIEDVSPLGSIAGTHAWSNDTEQVTLARSKEFIEFLKGHDKLDFILAANEYSGKKSLWFIDCAQLPVYETQAVDYKSLGFISFHPQVAGGRIWLD